MKVQKNSKKNIWRALAALLIITATIAVFNYENIKDYYSYTFKVEHFIPGDKMYLKKEFLNDGAPMVATFRAIRPLTIEEYAVTHYWYNEKEADAKYAEIDFPEKTFLIKSPQDIDKSKLKRSGSFLIGTYKGHNTLKFQDLTTDKISSHNFYEIIPEKTIISNEDDSVMMPPNYIWADEKIYISSDLVSSKR